MSATVHVILADIDGTLVDTRGAGHAAFRRSLAAAFGWRADDLADVDFAGATDLGVLRQVFRKRGLCLSGTLAARFFALLPRELAVAIGAGGARVLPGSRRLVRRLSARADVRLGLLTGNCKAGAHVKLSAVGLAGFFDFGGFGDEHADRRELARRALSRAAAPSGARLNVWVIGDTPADIRASRAIGARCLGVGTGPYTREALRRAGADAAMDDLADTDAAERALTGSPVAGVALG